MKTKISILFLLITIFAIAIYSGFSTPSSKQAGIITRLATNMDCKSDAGEVVTRFTAHFRP